ncbi:MAG: geranylgeranyl diphosphate reductase [Chloroflexaceae bacterium]|nr:geranylgeranyl diphosphate reductase [Chloroflexaceae bacterium]
MAQRVLIVGASVGGATAAATLRESGIETVMLERELVKPKPCGGAVPPAAFDEFDLPHTLIDRKVRTCAVTSPTNQQTVFPVQGTMPSDNDYVAMVRREVFDGFLRERAQNHGATLIHGTLTGLRVTASGVTATYHTPQGNEQTLLADVIIGADGAYSPTAKLLGLPPTIRAVALQERIALSPAWMDHWHDLAALYLGRDASPDLYAWVFPKCDHVAVGVGTGPQHTRSIRDLLQRFKARLGDMLDGGTVLLREAHALPMYPRKHLAYDRVMFVGDAAGLVVHTSGEGIYWAMKSGQMAAQVLSQSLDAPSAHQLRRYERLWWKQYGNMYAFLRMLQSWGYRNERQMEVFTAMCRNIDVQQLTFDSYMHKRMATMPWVAQLHMTRDIALNQLRYTMLERAVRQSSSPSVQLA